MITQQEDYNMGDDPLSSTDHNGVSPPEIMAKGNLVHGEKSKVEDPITSYYGSTATINSTVSENSSEDEWAGVDDELSPDHYEESEEHEANLNCRPKYQHSRIEVSFFRLCIL